MKFLQVFFISGVLALSLPSVCPAADSGGDDAIATPVKPATGEKGDALEKPDFRVRTDVFLKKLVSPQAFLETVPGTVFDQARNFPSAWGRGPDAFGKRFGSQYGQFVISELIVSGVSALHHEDPRYFPSEDKGLWKRTRHAVVSTFVCRDVNGGRTVALSVPAGVFGAWAVATQWSPPDVQGPMEILKWGSFGMLMKVGGNVLHEFWPDAKRLVLHRHTDQPTQP